MIDLAALIPKMQELAREVASRQSQIPQAIERGRQALAASDATTEKVSERVINARTSWLLAEPLETPGLAFDPPSPISDYVALGVDGSQIFPDRHEAIRCSLIQIGRVLIRYGERPFARIDARAVVGIEEEQDTPENDGTEDASSIRLDLPVAHMRTLMESSHLSEMVLAQEDDATVLAMLDGSLVFWWLENEPPRTREMVLASLFELMSTAKERQALLCSYISSPGSRDVVNALRTLICPFERADCDRHSECASPLRLRPTAPCGSLAPLTDSTLMQALLRPSQRSAVFLSRSKVLDFYRTEKIGFFYLHTGTEIARVELPQGLCRDEESLGRVHRLVLDQVQKGQGYPRVLTEAHEKAVVRGPDRQAFLQLFERLLIQQGVRGAQSKKAVSKRVRGV
jgi:hypothetical protein